MEVKLVASHLALERIVDAILLGGIDFCEFDNYLCYCYLLFCGEGHTNRRPQGLFSIVDGHY
jgi:hypothetical protein